MAKWPDEVVGVGVPTGGEPAGRVERGDVVPRLTTDVGEPSAHVDGGARDRQSIDPVVGVRVPGCGKAGRAIQSGDVRAGLPADRAELPGGVHRPTAHGESVDRGIGVGVPRRDGAGRGTERGDVVSHCAAGGDDVSAHVHGRPGHPERVDDRIHRRHTQVGIPRRREGVRGVESGNAVARLTADRGEVPAGVDHRSRPVRWRRSAHCCSRSTTSPSRSQHPARRWFCATAPPIVTKSPPA